MISKSLQFSLKCLESELHLENTLLNGQCFNWWKSGTDNQYYLGVYRNSFITINRKSQDEVQVNVEPYPDEPEIFQKQFKEYLNLDVDITSLYKEWSERDPVFFGVIASPLLGIRCLR